MFISACRLLLILVQKIKMYCMEVCLIKLAYLCGEILWVLYSFLFFLFKEGRGRGWGGYWEGRVRDWKGCR